MKITTKPTTQALHTAALIGFISLALLSPAATAADFSGSLKGVTITDAQAANKPPIATFTCTISGETVIFDASGSSDPDGIIAEYKWDFGDGTTGEGGTITHQFSSSGTYPITLTLLDNAKGVAVKQEKITTGGGAVFYWSVDTLPTTTMISDYGNITITKHSKEGTSVPGFKGNALKQTGTWQTYTIPMDHVPATKGTVSMYVQHDTTALTTDTTNRFFFTSTNQGAANALYAYTYKGMIFFYLYDSAGGYRRIYGTVPWETSKWYKYEFTWDAANGYLGIVRDGAVLLENTLESWQAKAPAWTGQQFFIGSTYPMGSFDEITINN